MIAAENDPDAGELIEGNSIREIVASYERAERDIRAAFGTIDGALDDLTKALGGWAMRLRDRHGNYVNAEWGNPAEHLKQLRRSAWSAIVERSQVRKAMSIAAWKKLQEQIERADPPKLTQKTVEDLITQFREDIPSMLEAAVHEVFDWLRPRCSDYKTNSEFEIGEGVVLGWMIETEWSGGWRLSYDREQNVIALENVFRLVDGYRSPPAELNGHSELSVAIRAVPKGEPCRGETPLFKFKGYKNRNLHLKFRRPELVAKLNAIAGGARLKPVGAA